MALFIALFIALFTAMDRNFKISATFNILTKIDFFLHNYKNIICVILVLV